MFGIDVIDSLGFLRGAGVRQQLTAGSRDRTDAPTRI
jgi:hypothetical protein